MTSMTISIFKWIEYNYSDSISFFLDKKDLTDNWQVVESYVCCFQFIHLSVPIETIMKHQNTTKTRRNSILLWSTPNTKPVFQLNDAAEKLVVRFYKQDFFGSRQTPTWQDSGRTAESRKQLKPHKSWLYII